MCKLGVSPCLPTYLPTYRKVVENFIEVIYLHYIPLYFNFNTCL